MYIHFSIKISTLLDNDDAYKLRKRFLNIDRCIPSIYLSHIKNLIILSLLCNLLKLKLI